METNTYHDVLNTIQCSKHATTSLYDITLYLLYNSVNPGPGTLCKLRHCIIQFNLKCCVVLKQFKILKHYNLLLSKKRLYQIQKKQIID